MKKILAVFACSLILYGCGSSDNTDNSAGNTQTESSTKANIEISLGKSVWNMSLPKTWEKMAAFPKKGIIFLAREGTQNIAISHEKGFSENLIENLFNTTKNSLSMVTEISRTENSLIFRGKLSATTPMREFYQKIFPVPNNDKFLLVSCSQEVASLDKLDCPDILDSIYLVGETKFEETE